MQTGDFILIIALLIGVFGVYVWKSQRAIADGEAFWYATVSEPIHFVSDTPFDKMVRDRADEARAKLKEHGNTNLKYDSEDPDKSDIWLYVYGATPECPTRDFGFWQDFVQLELLKRRAEWRQKKANWNKEAAQDRFGGQTTHTQTSSN